MSASPFGSVRRRAGEIVTRWARSFLGRRWFAYRLGRLTRSRSSVLLHLGCGERMLDGWINIDFVVGADVVLDLRRPIPLESESVDCIYSEDFLEHLTFRAGGALLAECCRLLKPGGTIRIATPDLRRFANAYLDRSERYLEWYTRHFPGISTFAQMFNTGMRAWGHQFLYDEETLRGVLERLGLQVRRAEFNESADPRLSGLEFRDSDEGAQSMYIEAVKEQRVAPAVSSSANRVTARRP